MDDTHTVRNTHKNRQLMLLCNDGVWLALVWGYLPMSDGGRPCVMGSLFSSGRRPVCCCAASGWDWQVRGTTVGCKAKGSTDTAG